MTETRMAVSLAHSIERDHNPRAYWKGALPSGDARSLLVDVADATGANGTRTFTVTVHEVDPSEGNDTEVQRLADLLLEGLESALPDVTDPITDPEMVARHVAQYMVLRGVHV
jgi:hypothetical protein